MQDNLPKSLPYKYYYFPVLLLVLLGLADTTYLTFSHYRNYTDITYSSFCALSRAINCDTVSQSPWSILFGMPVALWGFFGYLLYLLLLIAVRGQSAEKMSLWNLLFVLGALYSATALYFGYISATKIHSYCILCVLSYGISFLLFFYAWIVRRRFVCGSLPQVITAALRASVQDRFLRLAGAFLILLLIGTKFFLPHYWVYTLPDVSSAAATGVTEDGHPWIGAKHPVLTIAEYSDYLCFQCNKMHFILRRLVAEYPDRIRLVHHNYPMDHAFNKIVVPEPFHVGSGKMALLAIYATIRGKFWKMNDVLFQIGRAKTPFNTKMIARKTELTAGELTMAVRNHNIRLLLQSDIRSGMKLGITGTPSFVINGRVYQGSIPADILKQAIE